MLFLLGGGGGGPGRGEEIVWAHLSGLSVPPCLLSSPSCLPPILSPSHPFPPPSPPLLPFSCNVLFSCGTRGNGREPLMLPSGMSLEGGGGGAMDRPGAGGRGRDCTGVFRVGGGGGGPSLLDDGFMRLHAHTRTQTHTQTHLELWQLSGCICKYTHKQ